MALADGRTGRNGRAPSILTTAIGITGAAGQPTRPSGSRLSSNPVHRQNPKTAATIPTASTVTDSALDRDRLSVPTMRLVAAPPASHHSSRSYYEARGPVLHPLDEETDLVPFGEDPAARYPELRGEPFPSCPNRRG